VRWRGGDCDTSSFRLIVWFLDLGVSEHMYSIGSFGSLYVYVCV